jgi:hypothetical protein
MKQLKFGINGTSTPIFRTIIVKHRTGSLPLSSLDLCLEERDSRRMVCGLQDL